MLGNESVCLGFGAFLTFVDYKRGFWRANNHSHDTHLEGEHFAEWDKI